MRIKGRRTEGKGRLRERGSIERGIKGKGNHGKGGQEKKVIKGRENQVKEYQENGFKGRTDHQRSRKSRNGA